MMTAIQHLGKEMRKPIKRNILMAPTMAYSDSSGSCVASVLKIMMCFEITS